MRRAILALVFLASFQVVSGQGQSSPPSGDKAHAQDTKKPEPKPTSPDSVVVIQQETTTRQDGEANDAPKSYFARLVAPENLPNLILCVMGIAGIIVGICTLKVIERQTHHIARQAQSMRYQTTYLKNSVVQAEKAAEAALLSAQAVINAERPWLVIEIEEGEMGLDIIRAVNKGRTPAEMYDGHCVWGLSPVTGFVPGTNLQGPFFAPIQALTVSNDSFEVAKVDPISQLKNKAPEITDAIALFLYGQIRYWDTFSDRGDKTKLHETWWCFTYNESQKRWHRTANTYAKNT